MSYVAYLLKILPRCEENKTTGLFLSALCMSVITGCATTISKSENSVDKAKISQSVPAPVKDAKKSGNSETADGIIFGKVDFRGVLKVEYVKLNILDDKFPQKQYDLVFGGADEHSLSAWDGNPVEQHYFSGSCLKGITG